MAYQAISVTSTKQYEVKVLKQTAKTVVFEVLNYYASGRSTTVTKRIRRDKEYYCDLTHLFIFEVEGG